ncbi:MAG: SRPBCC family protein [Saprospiraceae bacterium]
MNILSTILILIAAIIVLLLIVALFTKKGYHIQRDIIINAPLEKVFEYIKQLKNWDNFNERAVADPSKKNEFKGIDGTVGFIYAWSGNKKVGEGEKEIMSISEGKKIETEIRFRKPFTLIGYTNMLTESISENQTKVTCSNASTLKYPLNILLLIVEKGIAKDMDISLATLKSILEK